MKFVNHCTLSNNKYMDEGESRKEEHHMHDQTRSIVLVSTSFIVRPRLKSVNCIADIHSQVDRPDFLIALEIIEADG